MTRAISLIMLGYAYAQAAHAGPLEVWLWMSIILGILSGWLTLLSRAFESAPNARAREGRGLLNPNRGAPMATYREALERPTAYARALSLAHREMTEREMLGMRSSDPFGLGL